MILRQDRFVWAEYSWTHKGAIMIVRTLGTALLAAACLSIGLFSHTCFAQESLADLIAYPDADLVVYNDNVYGADGEDGAAAVDVAAAGSPAIWEHRTSYFA
ncbi:MAG: hypothetical protein IIA67_05400, partial [Planctomycetes bacterium]|nr:hypothetical protein [Planctomycetota bacterium]